MWGAKVHGFALPATPGSLYADGGVEHLMARSTIGDIRDLPVLQAALEASDADIVLHMAAQPLVRLSYAQPVETFDVNVMGSVHLLEAVRHTARVRAVVMVTSDKCYENREWVWGYREDEPMGGYDPYSNSKGCCELITSAYRRSFLEGNGQQVGSARAGNVIGGGDNSFDRLVPDLVRAFRAGQHASIRNPKAFRPWQHVLEPLSGYLRLAEALCQAEGRRFASGWNFGPSEAGERSVGDVVAEVCKCWGEGGGVAP